MIPVADGKDDDEEDRHDQSDERQDELAGPMTGAIFSALIISRAFIDTGVLVPIIAVNARGTSVSRCFASITWLKAGVALLAGRRLIHDRGGWASFKTLSIDEVQVEVARETDVLGKACSATIETLDTLLGSVVLEGTWRALLVSMAFAQLLEEEWST